jgi:hypothetical protein
MGIYVVQIHTGLLRDCGAKIGEPVLHISRHGSRRGCVLWLCSLSLRNIAVWIVQDSELDMSLRHVVSTKPDLTIAFTEQARLLFGTPKMPLGWLRPFTR